MKRFDNQDQTQDESVEQILRTIRQVMTTEPEEENDSDEILELYQMITEDGAVINLKEQRGLQNKKPTSPAGKPQMIQPNDAAQGNLTNSYTSITTQKVEHFSVGNENATIDERLVSDNCAEAISEPLKKLLNTVANPAPKEPSFRSGNTLEELVIEMMQPRLTEWLENNLPNMVNEIVEREIKNIIKKELK